MDHFDSGGRQGLRWSSAPQKTPRGSRRWEARSHSDLEILFDKLLSASSLPPYERQLEVVARSGVPAHIDFAWPAARLGVECEGFDVHMRRLQWQSDMARQNALTEVGWLLLRFSWYDVTRRPEYVLDTIAATLEMRRRVA